MRAAEAGLGSGIAALKSCRIASGWLKRDGRRFTAEDLRSVINTRVMAEGCVPAHTICAPGDQAVDPHEEGHGPIRAHAPVIMDIFPRSEKTGYFGDLTRTVVRGRAGFALHELYAVVHEGVRHGHRRRREGPEIAPAVGVPDATPATPVSSPRCPRRRRPTESGHRAAHDARPRCAPPLPLLLTTGLLPSPAAHGS